MGAAALFRARESEEESSSAEPAPYFTRVMSRDVDETGVADDTAEVVLHAANKRQHAKTAMRERYI
jgi:hypothetical protein